MSDGTYPRLLIAVGEAADELDQLPDGVRALIDAADQVLVVAPALPTRLRWLASDTDKAQEIADARLRTALGQVRAAGKQAAGAVGADDPLLAFEDALRDFPADHILVGLRSSERAGWQERGLIDQVLELGVPVTVFELPS